MLASRSAMVMQKWSRVRGMRDDEWMALQDGQDSVPEEVRLEDILRGKEVIEMEAIRLSPGVFHWRRKQNSLHLESRTPSWVGLWTLSSMPSIYGNDRPTGKPGPQKEEPQGLYLDFPSPKRKPWLSVKLNRIIHSVMLIGVWPQANW